MLGFKNTYVFLPLDNHYVNNHHKRGMVVHKRLSEDNRVLWAEIQHEKFRQKREFLNYFLDEADRIKDKIHKKPLYTKGKPFNDELWTQEWYLVNSIPTKLIFYQIKNVFFLIARYQK